jgi:hypothetical protein
VISTVLLAEDMGLELKESLISCYLLIYAVMRKTLEFQGFERVSLATTDL